MYNSGPENYNVCVGMNSGIDISTGNKNAFLGPFAGQNNTIGYENTAVGYNAMGDGITTGSANIAIGPENAKITSGTGNIVMGYAALGVGGVTTGHRNICIGDATGYEITSGDYNILIGQNAGRNTTGTNSLNHIITGSNEIQLGNKDHTSAYIQIAWTVVSDKRDKTEFKEIPHGLDFVNKLKPTEYQFRKNRDTEETNGIKRYGFLAQDVLALEGDDPVIVKNHDPNLLTMTNDYLIPILVKSIQELKAEIEILKSK